MPHDGSAGSSGPAQDPAAPNGSGASGAQPRSPYNEAMEATSFLTGSNAGFVEAMYAEYVRNPSSVSPEWRAFFEDLGKPDQEVQKQVAGPSWKRRDWPPAKNGELISALDADWQDLPKEEEVAAKISAKAPQLTSEDVTGATRDSLRALMLIRAYRIRGHLIADLDPLEMRDHTVHPELDPSTYGFHEEDLDRPIFIDKVLGLETATLREILAILRRTYCGTFAVEFMHITDPEQKQWIQQPN